MTERQAKVILGNDSNKVYRMYDKFCKSQICRTCHYHQYDYCLVQWILDKQKEALAAKNKQG